MGQTVTKYYKIMGHLTEELSHDFSQSANSFVAKWGILLSTIEHIHTPPGVLKTPVQQSSKPLQRRFIHSF